MHHIYHTEGIILGSKNFKEANKYFYILTKDLGANVDIVEAATLLMDCQIGQALKEGRLKDHVEM